MKSLGRGPRFAIRVLRGLAQVMFLDSARAGAVFAVAPTGSTARAALCRVRKG
ncbi:hypothetical protein [Streptomyces sp. NPDC007856]|uniref:hypothetical protein n=1 Tax=Streptomyces sp. NPDC007856 TaxID=3364781 RepID=UPI0036C30DF7